MSKFQKDISIIVVSRNVIDLLRSCLKSVFEASHNLNVEVIVVDNASQDGTVDSLKRDYPQVQVIANQENLGFPKANNQAIKQATGRYILLLNPDTIVYPEALLKMTRYMDDHPEIGLIGPKVLTRAGTIQYDCARNFPDLWGCFTEISFLRRVFPRSRIFGHQYMTYWDHEDSRPVPCLVGAAMMVRRSAAESIGWFLDETIPMYLEDIDYCYRINQAGWTAYYLSEAIIEHWGGASTERSINRVSYELLKWDAYRLFFERYRSKNAARLLRLMVFAIGAIRVPAIAFGIVLRPILPSRTRPFFTKFTLVKAIALLGWALGIRLGSWSSR